MASPRDIFEAMEGASRRRWYVAVGTSAPVVLAGPVPTRREGRNVVARISRERGEAQPWWPSVETFEGYPGFSAMHTGSEVYYVGRASAFCDQGSAWADAISEYEKRLGGDDG